MLVQNTQGGGSVGQKTILLAGLPALLGDILEEAINEASADTVVARAGDLTEIGTIVSRERVNVIICSLGTRELLRECSEVVRNCPNPLVLSVDGSGKTLVGVEARPVLVHHGEASIEKIVSLVVAAQLPGGVWH